MATSFAAHCDIRLLAHGLQRLTNLEGRPDRGSRYRVRTCTQICGRKQCVVMPKPDSKADGLDVDQNSDFNSLLSSTCSSCEIQSDKSAYWTPQLYFAHANGKFEEVPNFGMTVYYVGMTIPPRV